jgi:hypothetical protein
MEIPSRCSDRLQIHTSGCSWAAIYEKPQGTRHRVAVTPDDFQFWSLDQKNLRRHSDKLGAYA